MSEPKIRFKQDDGSNYPDWTTVKLGDIATRVTRKNANNETDIPLTIASIEGLVDQRTYFGKTIASKDMSKYYLLQKGEFAYNKSYSVGYDYGSIKRLDKYDQGALSTLYICFALKDERISDFMACYFNSLAWNKEMPMICAEGARNHGLLNVPPADFFTIPINMPFSLEEQQKIASFLSDLDEVIVQSEAEVAALEKQKEGVMQQIFSQAVRFKKHDGSDYPEWEKKSFLSIITRIIDFRGRTPKKLGMEWSSEKTEYLALSAINVKKGYIDFTIDPHYGDEALYKKWMAGSELRKGQVLFTTEAPMGNVAQVPDNRPYILSQRTIAFNCDKNQVVDDFLEHLLLSPATQTDFLKLATGGTAQGISQKSLQRLKVIVPISIEEQRKIADFLSDFDTAIDLAKQELEKWKLLKKGLLQQMFV